MPLTGPFQRSLLFSPVAWSILFMTALVFWSSPSLAFQSFEDFSRTRNKISNVNVTALTDPVWVKPGGNFDLHLLVELSQGWHIYSLEAQSQGGSLATRIHFDENVFQPTGEWVEPKPTITLDGALDRVVKVHNDSVQFHRNLTVPGDLKPGNYKIAGEIEFSACDNKICSLPRKVGFQTRFRVPGKEDEDH